MRTQSPVFVVTGKEEAVLHVMEEIQNAAEHFTHIRASRNQHKSLGGGGIGGSGGLEVNKPASREGDVMIQVTVPYRVVGLVVGLKGQTIKAIQQDTDTFIVTPNRDKAPIFEIRGQPENVERAKSMILRHIETRTRHCRLQDSTNLPGNWSSNGGIDETMRGGSSGSVSGIGDFSMFQQHHSDSSNSDSIGSSSFNGSMSLANTNGSLGNSNQTFTSNGSGGGNHFSPSFASSISPPANGNYGSWSGYNGMFDHQPNQSNALHHNHQQQQNCGRSMTAWSTATSDFTPGMSCNGVGDPSSFCGGSSHVSMNSSLRSAQPKNFLSMNMGSMSSSSNSSASISPPHDFISEGPYPSSHHQNMPMVPYYPPMGASPPIRGLLNENASDPADISSFPLLSGGGSSSPGSTKGSLVLGNLFRSSNSGASSNVGMSMLSGSSCSNSSNNSTASPTSTDGFHRIEDQATSFTVLGFAAGGPATAAAPPVNSLGASSSSTSSSSSYPLATDAAVFAGASGGGIHSSHPSQAGVETGNTSYIRYHKEDSSLTNNKVPPMSLEDTCSQSSPTPRLCRVCEEAEVVAALVPCGHNLFCMDCAERITNRPSADDRKCPACKENVSDVLRIRA
ncbi:RNA-binding protein mex3b [Plakobranchus ocellatus]|uniref:RNA-binding protein mex3b n=1 Tax=Plakobranchus ocellatus TaxID=259542 RepID=A0AAV4B6X1_9GAST|nr:RNA-binding protein mex3b [Plakobranchus ocellatus]